MKARCQIRTNGEQIHALCYPVVLGFLTDSKAVNSIEHLPVCKVFVNGLERAFTKVPAKLRGFHSNAARRDW